MDHEPQAGYEALPTASDRMLELARKLGIEVTADMDPSELSKLIKASPATSKQRQFAESLLGSRLPPEATFGQVSQLLNGLVPLKNQIALQVAKWDTGDVLVFRGDYYRVTGILTKHDYRVFLQPVDLEPAPMGEPAGVVDRKAPKQWHYPVTLVEEAQKVDLLNWTSH